MKDWKNHKLESRLLGEVSATSDMHMIPLLMAESKEELKSLLMSVKQESEKAGLKLNIRILRSWHPVPSLHAYRWGKNGNSFSFLGSKITSDSDCSWDNKRRFLLILEKAEEPEIKLPTSVGSLKKQEWQKNINFCFIDYAKAFDCVDHNKLWKILKEMGIPDHLTCLLRNLYAGQEATVRTGHGTDWFQIGKGVSQGYILSLCLFNFYAEYIMRNTGLDETQTGIKIAGRNINNLRYADDTTLMAEIEEELKNLLMKV